MSEEGDMYMKAVIYCRVSTDEEKQVNALKGQVQEAIAAVHKQKWKLVDQYIDEGRSGTTTKKRDEYNRLVSELDQNKFDVIVVKSQDRLMRNTKEWYVFVDKLVQAQKKLFFYLDNKFYTPDDALITGIKAILAEEFSRDLSKKINNAHKSRQEKGTNVSITSNTWGYNKVKKEVVINEKEAEIVRLIYQRCIEGKGSRIIAKELQTKRIKSRSGGKFPEATIRRIIRNPLFKGTAVMNKRHMDFNTKRTMYTEEADWIYHEHIIPAIIDEEIWDMANRIMDLRTKLEKTEEFVTTHRGRNLGKSNLSSKIICGECGCVYWLRFRNNVKGEQIKEWSCSEYVQRGRKTLSNRSTATERVGGCDNIHIKDSDLQNILYEIGRKLYSTGSEELMQQALVSVIERAITPGVADMELFIRIQESIMKKRELLVDKMMEGVITDDLFEAKDESLKKEYDSITAKIDRMHKATHEKDKEKDRIKKIAKEIADINDRKLVLYKLIDHITQITIYMEHAVIHFDFFEDISFKINRISYRLVEMTL
jgi:site-specific DNA recombinase